ncbi:hypothetical protein NDN08_004975 [Rhodosorus marinus]|uniref:Queuosine salvage protein n=1 Tax=Rhodosorus marinus TaxID=101924 RepID=A0AAV8UF57_9RHOD|nr:hypothetical protein NDN08_004975 [Rhodosorus marinus]
MDAGVGNGDDGMYDLRRAFGALSDETKVGAVIEALCSEGKVAESVQALEQVYGTGRAKVPNKTKTVMIDAAVTSGDTSNISLVMTALAPTLNGYGVSTCAYKPEASKMEIPDQQRQSAVLYATTFLSVNIVSIGLELVDVTTGVDTDIPGELFLLEVLFLFADVFLWRRDAIKKVMDGLQRIFEKDNIRKCRVEASSFVAAYLLGVPLLCYRPSRESMALIEAKDNLDKLLVWAMAGPASEVQIDGKLIETDETVALNLLKSLPTSMRRGLGLTGEEEALNRVRWALAEASKLLQFHSGLLAEVERRMLAGASVGECVQFVEQLASGTPPSPARA